MLQYVGHMAGQYAHIEQCNPIQLEGVHPVNIYLPWFENNWVNWTANVGAPLLIELCPPCLKRAYNHKPQNESSTTNCIQQFFDWLIIQMVDRPLSG